MAWLEETDTAERSIWANRFRVRDESLGNIVKTVMQERRDKWFKPTFSSEPREVARAFDWAESQGIRIPSRDTGSSATELEPHDEDRVAHHPMAEQDGIWRCSCGTWNPDGIPCTFMQPWKRRQSSAGSAISTTQADADEERSLGSSMTPIESVDSLQQGHQQRLNDLLQYQANKPEATQQQFSATGPN